MISGFQHRAFSVKQWSCILLSIVIQLFSWHSCYGDERVEAIKTAYLYNFAKFTHWPDIPETANLHIQIIGKHPFGKSLSTLTTKTIAKHSVKISTLVSYNPEQPPNVLFISRSSKSSLHSILKSVSEKQVLTVSDIPEFTDNGGMIELIEKRNNIRFRINLDASKKSGVDLSSQILRLADSIIHTSSGTK